MPRCRDEGAFQRDSIGKQPLGLASSSVVITLTTSDKYQRVLKRALWEEESIDSANLIPAMCQKLLAVVTTVDSIGLVLGAHRAGSPAGEMVYV